MIEISQLELQKRITRQITNSDLPKLAEHYESISNNLKDLEKFDKELEKMIQEFNKKFDDKFFEIDN
ncbi:Putative uncharacterized protein [Mycoplasma leachii 99/014/6]|uniref:hypothetical protein n=1 Tax=Mycoplasma leachii TaxID=2105 RepID=UPI00021771D2|nr:hypothetical protein [Mycoplasma leachii]CBV67637.1 Putative uncharacterized protein [Mycoplasma leachii 99/014/6]